MLPTNMHVKPELQVKFVKASDAFRVCVKAIVEDDTMALTKAVGTTCLPIEMAINVASQALRKDISRGKMGYRACEGGLLSAVYVGVMEAQKAAGTESIADNATLLIVSLAIDKDEPLIIDVLIDWDPHFRMGPIDSRLTVNTTVQFFLDANAPKCAARLMERKGELVVAPRNSYLDEHAEERVLRNSKALLAKGSSFHPLAIAALEQLIDNNGKIPVLDVPNRDLVGVFSIGLSLLGHSEVFAVCSAVKVKEMSERIHKLINQSVRGDTVNLPDAKRFIKLGECHLLTMLTDAAKHLRRPGTPSVVFLKE